MARQRLPLVVSMDRMKAGLERMVGERGSGMHRGLDQWGLVEEGYVNQNLVRWGNLEAYGEGEVQPAGLEVVEVEPSGAEVMDRRAFERWIR